MSLEKPDFWARIPAKWKSAAQIISYGHACQMILQTSKVKKKDKLKNLNATSAHEESILSSNKYVDCRF